MNKRADKIIHGVEFYKKPDGYFDITPESESKNNTIELPTNERILLRNLETDLEYHPHPRPLTRN